MSSALAELGESFCSYCGRPPVDGSPERANRVCPRCKLGMVLATPAGAPPSHTDAFMIVDRDLIVRGLSRRAEVLLAVNEPAAVHTPLDALLVCDDGDADGAELSRLIGLSLAHTPTSNTVSLRSVADPLVRFRARVTCCGPPPAVVLILAPIQPKLTAGMTNGIAGPRAGRSSKDRAPAIERRHSRGRPPGALGAPGSQIPLPDLRRSAGLDLLIAYFARSVQSEVALLYGLNGDGEAATLISSWGLGTTRQPEPPFQAGLVGGALVSGRAALGPLDSVHDAPLIMAPADGRLTHAGTAPVRFAGGIAGALIAGFTAEPRDRAWTAWALESYAALLALCTDSRNVYGELARSVASDDAGTW
jgi:hypothetical protein